MDFNERHLEDASAVTRDLSNCKNALELIIGAGKATEWSETELQKNPSLVLEINNGRLSCGHILEMIEAARRGRALSYAPYSHFNVGAAILAKNRKKRVRLFNGCNVENAAYGSTVCAERTAAFKAISEGFRMFHAYAVVGGFDDSMPQSLREAVAGEYITPCGSCRQVTNEFDADPCVVIVATDTGRVLMTTLEYLLPVGFGPKSLGVDASSYDRHNT